jgi:hypothetical protein
MKATNAHKAIRLSLLRYLKTIIAHVRICRLIVKHGSSRAVP